MGNGTGTSTPSVTPPWLGVPVDTSISTGANLPLPATNQTAPQLQQLLKILSTLKQGNQNALAPAPQSQMTVPGQVGGAPPQMMGPVTGSMPAPVGTPPRGGYEPPAFGSQFMSKLDPSGAATYSAIQGVSKVLQDWAARKDQKEHVEAANIAQNLMNALSNNDVAAVHDILNDPKSTKVLNKVYKGWLEKAQEAQEPGEAPDPTVAGFEAGLKQYTQKGGQGGAQGQQPQGGAPGGQTPPGTMPRTMGGYRLPQASPQTQADATLKMLQTQNQIRQQQALAQQPASPYSPEQQAAIIKAQSEAQIAALNVQKEQAALQKTQAETQAALAKGTLEKDKAQADLLAAQARAQTAATNLEIAKTKLQVAKAGGKITPATQAKINGAKSALDIIDNITGGKGDTSTNTLTGIKNSLIVAGLPGLAKQISEGGLVKSQGLMPGMVKSTPTSSDELKRIRPQIQAFYDGITKTGTADTQSSTEGDGEVIDVSPEEVEATK